jgi:hypothetical protein
MELNQQLGQSLDLHTGIVPQANPDLLASCSATGSQCGGQPQDVGEEERSQEFLALQRWADDGGQNLD